jgi:molecular chaperone GrpE
LINLLPINSSNSSSRIKETGIAMSSEPQQPKTENTAESPAAAADGTPASHAEVMPSMEELLKKAELAAAEHHDAWMRAKAETENIRKRAVQDVANAHKFAIEGFASELLPVCDSLEAALATETATVESLKSGAELTLKQLVAAFEKFKLKAENPMGQKFDPHRHQAIGMVESDAEPNTVTQVLQKGYVLNDRVVRPAMVMVARAKSTEAPGAA